MRCWQRSAHAARHAVVPRTPDRLQHGQLRRLSHPVDQWPAGRRRHPHGELGAGWNVAGRALDGPPDDLSRPAADRPQPARGRLGRRPVPHRLRSLRRYLHPYRGPEPTDVLTLVDRRPGAGTGVPPGAKVAPPASRRTWWRCTPPAGTPLASSRTCSPSRGRRCTGPWPATELALRVDRYLVLRVSSGSTATDGFRSVVPRGPHRYGGLR